MGDGMDFEAYLAQVEAFTREELIPSEERVEELGHVPEDLVRRICEMRLFAISIPEEYGGLGLSQEQQVRLTFAFTRASAVFRARFSTTIGLCSQALLDFATEAQKLKYLPAMAEGRCTGAFSLTEPDYGSDAANLATTAVRDGADYVLNGTKRYITNAADADMFLVMARTGGPGAGGVSAFAVDAGTPGIRAGEPVEMMGHRG
ncbi:MAG: acyl-CoA dehydrogenase family protein, partial [Alphaproteobacteria bacterium]|nr:acyl-CoA dehydrogenase family protein [Alphaproteobacteria bacterium]